MVSESTESIQNEKCEIENEKPDIHVLAQA
jgi:hypothetical protein